MGILIWDSEAPAGVCALRRPKGIEKLFQLQRGISRAESWPNDAACSMDEDFPDEVELADNLNAVGLKVVSAELRAALEAEMDGNVEFLSVRILHHDGREVSDAFSILNPLEVHDCIDLEASQVKWNKIKKDMISGAERLVLHADAIPKGTKMFRPKGWPRLILVQRELAEKLQERGFTGLYFREPVEFTGI